MDAIVNDTLTEVDVNDGLQPVLIGLAAKRSKDEGRPVKISEFSILRRADPYSRISAMRILVGFAYLGESLEQKR